ncbi:MAG: ribosomal L7Ae/L30e/S12e/Gadd45 family protein [Defluviitaleaceae bacterium]|nr:ribosomal L7Ae/L30e/S12e/Gadd45 family protein [Defluviitaleaceae bacterium]
MDRRIASLLSLSTKAGMLYTGEETAEKLLQRGNAQLVIIAVDASDNTKKKFVNKCFFYKRPIRIFGERDVMSKCVGKSGRTVYVITDNGFAVRLQALIDDSLS